MSSFAGRSSVSFQPWTRTRTAVSEDVSTAMVAPSLQEVGNQTTFVVAREESAMNSRRIRVDLLSRFARRSIKYLSSSPHAASPSTLLLLSCPLVVYEYVFHVRGFDRFPINENAVLNTVKRGTVLTQRFMQRGIVATMHEGEGREERAWIHQRYNDMQPPLIGSLILNIIPCLNAELRISSGRLPAITLIKYPSFS